MPSPFVVMCIHNALYGGGYTANTAAVFPFGKGLASSVLLRLVGVAWDHV